ncbi:serine protease inhibitor 3/4-like [Musca vetustissima]|uniref:serine protease inhibitor 3/4-like n=1 Tax=Musca vetustissima TaxID=27455 RepID=UPI002AB656EA|nr:serine protease inhibitor 3/4-like [Musca vetustissima]
MGVNTHFIATICAMILTVVAVVVATPTTIPNDAASHLRDVSKSLDIFGTKLYSKIATQSGRKNIIFSPFSIETSLAITRLGASGQTAEEIDQGLSLKFNNGVKLANYFQEILAAYQTSDLLQMANKVYVMENFELYDQYKELLAKNFYTSAENLNFTQNIKAAETINSWVASKTHQLIKDLIAADDLDERTRMVLLNAIYFNGEWLVRFHEQATFQKPFYVDATNSVDVAMMQTHGEFRYGQIDQLDASALEMRYKNSDLYMLIILPNARDGLEDLRIKLQSYSLEELRAGMVETKVLVEMPKFAAEYKIELKEILKSLGIERMFSADAELTKMVKGKFEVTKVLHKASIAVNEKGTEAAAATVLGIEKII